MRFELKIELGDDTMQTGRDVARALQEVALRVMRDAPMQTEPLAEGAGGRIRDDNGNTVGRWYVIA